MTERLPWTLGGALLLVAFGCASEEQQANAEQAPIVLFADAEPAEFDPTVAHKTQKPAAQSAASAAPSAAGPLSLAATIIATTVFAEPNRDGNRIGYIRLGGIVERAAQPTPGKGCKQEWYEIKPHGFVCLEEATLDLEDPLVRATQKRPDLSSPLPYHYGFVRATAPQYLRIPTKEEQIKSEFKLEEHIAWYEEHRYEVQRVILGANDVPLDSRGIGTPGLAMPEDHRLSTLLDSTELLGGGPGDGTIPFWLQDGRAIPNVSGFEVPDYAVFADRVRRKTGLSFVDAFVAHDGDFERRFGVTVDMRLIPATKVKPDTGSPFHGVELSPEIQLPVGFVLKRSTTAWKLIKGKDEARPAEAVPRRALVPLSGKVRIKAGQRFYQLARNPMRWLQASDVGVIAPPPEWPEPANKGEKWIDISLVQQVLVLYQGKQPWYATLVSTGQDRLGDPETSKATPRGSFSIQSKHIAAAMDSEENSDVSGGTKTGRKHLLDAEARATIARVTAAEKAGKSLSEEDRRRLINIQKGRHPEYGVTMRRGSRNFELRDVPWIQYFAAGYALHGAYWHDVFGIPRSHGCVNLAPIDARVVFNWTEPAVPEGWHGINTGSPFGEGTPVIVRE